VKKIHFDKKKKKEKDGQEISYDYHTNARWLIQLMEIENKMN
jgi:hypothetical protein